MAASALARLTIAAGLALVLTGCNTLRDAAGVNKKPPDEFAMADVSWASPAT